MYGIRVLVADGDPGSRKNIKEMLLNAGHLVVGETSHGGNAMQLAFSIQPDLVIMDSRLPGRDGLEAAKRIAEHRIAPVIIVTEPDRQDDLECLLAKEPRDS